MRSLEELPVGCGEAAALGLCDRLAPLPELIRSGAFGPLRTRRLVGLGARLLDIVRGPRAGSVVLGGDVVGAGLDRADPRFARAVVLGRFRGAVQGQNAVAAQQAPGLPGPDAPPLSDLITSGAPWRRNRAFRATMTTQADSPIVGSTRSCSPLPRSRTSSKRV